MSYRIQKVCTLLALTCALAVRDLRGGTAQVEWPQIDPTLHRVQNRLLTKTATVCMRRL